MTFAMSDQFHAQTQQIDFCKRETKLSGLTGRNVQKKKKSALQNKKRQTPENSTAMINKI